MSNPSWHFEYPERGDHIRVCRMGGIYYHHGIFVSADEVIHFTGDDDDSVLDWSKAHIIKTSLQTFLAGGEVEVAHYDADEVYPVDDVVTYARDCIGESGYNLFFENCEHFATECKIGEHRSPQVERFISGTKVVTNVIGGNTMGLFSSIMSNAMGIGGKILSTIGDFVFGSSDSSTRKRPPAKSDQVKLAEIERDKQTRLAEIESNTALSMADKENARAKIEHDAKLKLAKIESERLQAERAAQIEYLQKQTQARMAEAAQQAKFAEMEHQWQLKLADKDNERIGLMRDAQLDIIKAQTMSQMMIERARVEGQAKLADYLVGLQAKIVELSKQRLLIISSGEMKLVRDIEKFYGELTKSIEARKDEYDTKKLPQLLDVLTQYEQGTPQYNLYFRQIEKDQDTEQEFLLKQMDAALKRQQSAIDSLHRSKELIAQQTGELMQIIEIGYLPAGEGAELKQIDGAAELPKLSGATHETKLLSSPT